MFLRLAGGAGARAHLEKSLKSIGFCGTQRMCALFAHSAKGTENLKNIRKTQ